MRQAHESETLGHDNGMIDYIKRNFADMLGPHLKLLDEPGGLDTLSDLLRSGEITARNRRAA